MRYGLLLLILAVGVFYGPGLKAAGTGAAQPNIVVTPLPPVSIGAPADQWANSGQRQFGPNYELYVPMEFKSDMPGVMRSFDPAAHPQNGNQLTAAGEACSADNDCQPPLGCFNRADSGRIPIKLCALPAGR